MTACYSYAPEEFDNGVNLFVDSSTAPAIVPSNSLFWRSLTLNGGS